MVILSVCVCVCAYVSVYFCSGGVYVSFISIRLDQSLSWERFKMNYNYIEEKRMNSISINENISVEREIGGKLWTIFFSGMKKANKTKFVHPSSYVIVHIIIRRRRDMCWPSCVIKIAFGYVRTKSESERDTQRHLEAVSVLKLMNLSVRGTQYSQSLSVFFFSFCAAHTYNTMKLHSISIMWIIKEKAL